MPQLPVVLGCVTFDRKLGKNRGRHCIVIVLLLLWDPISPPLVTAAPSLILILTMFRFCFRSVISARAPNIPQYRFEGIRSYLYISYLLCYALTTSCMTVNFSNTSKLISTPRPGLSRGTARSPSRPRTNWWSSKSSSLKGLGFLYHSMKTVIL